MDVARVRVVYVGALFFWRLVAGGCFPDVDQRIKSFNCTQIAAQGNLQDVLINISLAQPSDACVQVNISPGSYVISRTLNLSQDVVLRGIGNGVVISFYVTAYRTDRPLYVMQFGNTDFAALDNIDFVNSSGIIGFENVTEVLINNCSFR